ncbi:tetratricopeptide repeat protein [Flavobacterium jejuense]|uniref:histidine kinase n=1 Tax=Flavobacterium jejuense TaxID=1544455 RepID=A0ABX0IQW1_9FLAO|nr:ATP-binding protein [Flavobacterium jejuense]NHN26242.1 tetratricopeptide repeat protein [Flavobacterium jejuense]
MKVNKSEKGILLLLDEANQIRINNLPKSITLAHTALDLSSQIGSKPLLAKSYSQLGLYYMVIGEMDKSETYSKEALAIFTILKDEKGIADAKYSLAGVYYKTNLYHLGLISFIDALKIYQKEGDYYNQSRTEKSLGTIYGYIGDQSNALKSYNCAIKNARKINDFNLESNVYNNLSGILAKNGKLKFAMAFINRSIEQKEFTNDIRGMAYALYGKGKVYFCLKEYEKAEDFYFKALKIHDEMGENTGRAMTYTKLGELYYAKNNLDLALKTAFIGLEIATSLKLAMSTIKLKKLIYIIYKAKNEPALALDYFERYQKEKESVINSQTLKVIENYELISKMEVLKNETKLHKEKQLLLEKKNQDEAKAIKMRQDFLSIMSHEIRTPLNAITSIVELLNDEISNEGRELLSSLKFASSNLINIVNDVLDFTKLDSNKSKLEITQVQLARLVKNIVSVYDKQAMEKGLVLKLSCSIPDKNSYNLDETKLTQVLNNLISNAIKFTEKGNVELKINEVKSTSKKDTILFEVIDSGEGILKENLDEIFESFSQVKPILTRKQGGTGLGLAIVKKIIELYNSKIKVRSVVGKGTTFYFKLKVPKKQLVENDLIEKKIVVKNINLKGKKVLIVEDTVINAVLLSKLLSKWEIESEHVENGMLALEKVKENFYDFILMDIHMPNMNGLEVTKIIKTTTNLNTKTPVIALTADTMVTSKNYETNHFSGFLWKPFEIDRLKEVLERVF